MGPEHDTELVELAGLRYWNEHEARVVVEAWRRSGESRAAFSRRYGIHPTRLGRWARQMEDRAEEPILFHPVHLVQREERGWGGPIEIELGRDCRVRVAGGFETRDLERTIVGGSKAAPTWFHPGLPEFPGTPGRVVMLACRRRHVPGFWPPHWEVVVIREPEALPEVWERCSVFVVWPGCEGAKSVLESLMILSELGARVPVLLAKAVDAAGDGTGQPPLEPAPQGLSVRRVLRREDLALSIHEGVARTVLEGFCQGVVETFNPSGILRSAIRFLCHQAPPWTYEGLGEPECGNPGFVRFVKDLAPGLGCTARHLRRESERAGIALGSLVDWTVLLHGMSWYDRHLMNWTRIARHLGFETSSALSAKLKRTAAGSSRELLKEPWRELLARAVEGMRREERGWKRGPLGTIHPPQGQTRSGNDNF